MTITDLRTAEIERKDIGMTYSAYFLFSIGSDVGKYHRIKANYTADGVEAIYVDGVDGQKYRLSIKPIQEWRAEDNGSN